MTLKALNGSWCSDNNEVVIMKPSVVAFECIFALDMVDTTYTWFMGIDPLPFTTPVVYINILSGSHTVSCGGYLSVEGCNCTETKSIAVTVVGA